jgi:rSAM/selenodomain-associated transferase 2
MPVFNEAKNLRDTLDNLKLTADEELIVVDGGSSDKTMSIAREYTDKVFQTETGRASVMNYGAAKADGDILLFLHADCSLPENCFSLIRETLYDVNVAAGGFTLHINHSGFHFRLIEFFSNLRAGITSLIYGDQGMFMRKQTFEELGGFAEILLMEDIEISRRIRRKGKIIFVKSPITVSPRRWIKEGVFYTTLRDWIIAFLYAFLKVSPERLIRYYRDVR